MAELLLVLLGFVTCSCLLGIAVASFASDKNGDRGDDNE